MDARRLLALAAFATFVGACASQRRNCIPLTPEIAAQLARPHAIEPPFFPGAGVPNASFSVAAFVCDGTLSLVSLSDGVARWEAKGSFLAPLVVDGDLVVAAEWLTNRTLSVVVLDASSGARLSYSEGVALPKWAPLAPDDGGATEASARIAPDGELVLYWTARDAQVSGPPPPSDTNFSATRSAQGAARIDLTSGRVIALTSDDATKELVRRERRTSVAELPPGAPAEASGRSAAVFGVRLYYAVGGVPSSSQPGTTETVLHAFDLVGRVDRWTRVVRRERLVPPPP